MSLTFNLLDALVGELCGRPRSSHFYFHVEIAAVSISRWWVGFGSNIYFIPRIYCAPRAFRTSTSRSTSSLLPPYPPSTFLPRSLNSTSLEMPNAAQKLIADKDFQQAVKKLIPAIVSKMKGTAKTQQRRTNGRRNNQALLRAGASLRSMRRGPTAPKAARYKGGATSNTTFAPRGQGLYDAFASIPDSAILASTVGPSTPIEGYARFVVAGSSGVVNLPYELKTGAPALLHPTPLTSNAKLIVFNCGSSDSWIASVFELVDNGSGRAIVAATPIHCSAFAELGPTTTAMEVHPYGGAYPLFGGVEEAQEGGDANDDDITQRIESIPLRGSLRIRNVTEHYSVGGEVRMMRYNGGLFLGHNPNTGPGLSHTPPGIGTAEFVDICDMMRDTKRAVTFGGDELLPAHQANTYPADSIRSHTFMADTSFVEATLRPKFCTMMILIDDFKAGAGQVNNTYSLNFVVQRAARFKPGSLLHNKARTLSADPNKHHTSSTKEATSNIAAPVAAAAASSMMKGLLNGPYMSALRAASKGGYGNMPPMA